MWCLLNGSVTWSSDWQSCLWQGGETRWPLRYVYACVSCFLFFVFCFLFFPWTIKYNKISWINVISYCGIVIRDGGENLSTGYANTIFGGVRGTLRDWQSLIHLSSVLCPLFTRDFSTDVGVKAWELFRSITKVLKCTKWGKNENGLMDLLT